MTEAVLQTRGLFKAFGALQATEDVSIELRPGEIHAVIGPNGAGKSTLIGQISGAIVPDAGAVLLGGVDVTGLTVPARARAGLARTFQISQLAMEDTVLQNALLGALGAAGRPFDMLRPVARRGRCVTGQRPLWRGSDWRIRRGCGWRSYRTGSGGSWRWRWR